jgi:hypothetical protein
VRGRSSGGIYSLWLTRVPDAPDLKSIQLSKMACRACTYCSSCRALGIFESDDTHEHQLQLADLPQSPCLLYA